MPRDGTASPEGAEGIRGQSCRNNIDGPVWRPPGIRFIWDLYETTLRGCSNLYPGRRTFRAATNERAAMSDFLYVLAGLAFFALAILYVTATERL